MIKQVSTPNASKLLTDAAAAMAKGDVEQARVMVEQAELAEPRLRRAIRKAPQTIDELMPLLRRKDVAGQTMRQVRQSLGFSQMQIAEICGVSHVNVAYWEM